MARECRNKREEAKNHIYLGYYFLRFSNIKEALSNFDSAYRIYKALKENEGIAESLKGKADVNSFLVHFDVANQQYQEALKLFRLINYSVKILDTMRAQACLLLKKGEIFAAEKKLINVYEEACHLNGHLVAQVAYDLGKFYFKKKDYKKALEYYEEAALKFKDSYNNTQDHNIAITKYFFTLGLNDYKFGRQELEKLLKDRTILNNPCNTAFILKHIGILDSVNHNFLQADQAFQEAIELLEKEKLKTSLLKVYIAVATHSYRKGDVRLSETYYLKAAKLSQEIEDKYAEASIYQALSKMFKAIDPQKFEQYSTFLEKILKEFHFTLEPFESEKAL